MSEAAEAETIRVSAEDLTLGDLEDFEEAVGEPLFEILPTNKADLEKWRPKAKVLIALVWLVKRLEQPEFTLADARKVKVAALELDVGSSADPPPAAD